MSIATTFGMSIGVAAFGVEDSDRHPLVTRSHVVESRRPGDARAVALPPDTADRRSELQALLQHFEAQNDRPDERIILQSTRRVRRSHGQRLDSVFVFRFISASNCRRSTAVIVRSRCSTKLSNSARERSVASSPAYGLVTHA